VPSAVIADIRLILYLFSSECMQQVLGLSAPRHCTRSTSHEQAAAAAVAVAALITAATASTLHPTAALHALHFGRRLLASPWHCTSSLRPPLQQSASSNTARFRARSRTEQAAMAAPSQISANKCFGGYNRRYKHASSSLGCDMTFTVYFPPAADETAASPSKVRVITFVDYVLGSLAPALLPISACAPATQHRSSYAFMQLCCNNAPAS
jgi:hypothetical protein